MIEKCREHIWKYLLRFPCKEHLPAMTFIAFALVIQAFLFFSGRIPLDQDDCYLGIQGLDILKGSWPVLFPGQNYMGSLEAYFHVIFRLILGGGTALTLKTQAAVQMLIFLFTFYLFVRRFFDRSIVLFALLLLCVPPNFLAYWYGKIRGYMPPLILGNGILYLLFRLDEKDPPRKLSHPFFFLGLLIGIAWWANPISIYYGAFIFLLSLISPRLRASLWRDSFRSLGIVINGFALLFLMILEFRTLFVTKHIAFFNMLFHSRHIVWVGLILFIIFSFMIKIWKPKTGISLFLLCMGAILGSIPLVLVYWNSEIYLLRQGPGNLYIFCHNIVLTPFFVFPIIAGLTNIITDTDSLLFPRGIIILVGLFYMGIIYYTLRIGFRTGRNHRNIILLGFVILILFWTQKIYVWYQSRFFLPFYIPLFIMMAFFFRELNRVCKYLGTLLVSLLIVVHIWGIVGLPANDIIKTSGLFPYEQKILDFCQRHHLKKVFIILSDDQVVRLTYLADKKIIFHNPLGYSDRLVTYETRYQDLSVFNLIFHEDTSLYSPLLKQPNAKIEGFHIFLDLSLEQFQNLCSSISKARNEKIKRIYENVP